MSTLECKFCHKTYSSISSLNYHQKTAKYCLKIQHKDNEEIKRITFDCEYCNKQFSSKQRLNFHSDNCIDKYKKIIEDLNQKLCKNEKITEQKDCEIKELEKIIEDQKQEMKTIRLEVENEFYKQREERSSKVVEEIAKQPRTTNNNQKVLITTPIDLSQPSVQMAIQQGFSEEYLVQGQKGVARFAVDNILKDEQGKLKYICTDSSRQIFQYKDGEGKLQKDVRATKLTKALLEGDIKHASHVIACEKMADGGDKEFNVYTNHYYEIKDLETDNSEFSKELTTLAV
tara:strand:+ start:559 stop:1419 length:861 start_codon:yes stop_codon:yes gene_type:complete